MDKLTLNLANFALNMHRVTQQVASKNIASADFQSRFSVDFDGKLQALQQMDATAKTEYLQQLNSLGVEGLVALQKNTGQAVDVASEHASSTRAMLEYQALVEVLNRKMGLMSLVIRGNR